MLALRMMVVTDLSYRIWRRHTHNPGDFAVINMTESGKGWRSSGPATDQLRHHHSAVLRAGTDLLSQSLDLVDKGAKILNQAIEG